MNKHYIRLDENNMIIKGFSDAFETPSETDICIREDIGRHFAINNTINPVMFGELGEPLYKYNGFLQETTDAERQTWIDSNIVEEADPDEELAQAIEQATNFEELKSALLGNMGNSKIKGRKK